MFPKQTACVNTVLTSFIPIVVRHAIDNVNCVQATEPNIKCIMTNFDVIMDKPSR